MHNILLKRVFIYVIYFITAILLNIKRIHKNILHDS